MLGEIRLQEDQQEAKSAEYFSKMVIHWITDNDQMEKAISKLNKYSVICIDVETSGLNPHRDRLWMVQLRGKGSDDVYVIDATKCDVKGLRTLLESKVLLGAELKFELKWLRVYDIRPSKCLDVVIISRVLTCGLGLQNSLAACSLRYRDIKMDKTLQKSFIADPKVAHRRKNIKWTEAQLRYAAMDTYGLEDILKVQLQEATEKGMMEIVKLEDDTVPVAADMEYDGILIDFNLWNSISDCAERNIISLRKELCESLLGKGAQTFLFERDDGLSYDINLNSVPEMLRRFKEVGIDLPNLKETEIKLLKNPLVNKYTKYRQYLKMVGTYGKEWERYKESKTGRIHADVIQIADRLDKSDDNTMDTKESSGTQTGRFASKNPNIENVPTNKYNKYSKDDSIWLTLEKEKYDPSLPDLSYRHCFIPEKGFKFIDIDYSQMEIRILAQVSGDKNLRQVLASGEDVHSATASLMYKVPLDQCGPGSEYRKNAKTLNFALMYGQGPLALARTLGIVDEASDFLLTRWMNKKKRLEDAKRFEEAKELPKPTQREIDDWAMDKASKIIDAYFDALPDVKKWLYKVQDYPRVLGYSATPLGRRRSYEPLPEDMPLEDLKRTLAGWRNQGKNMPVQGTCADIVKRAAVEMRAEFLRRERAGLGIARIVNIIHDEFLIEAQDEIAEEIKTFAENKMVEVANRLLPDVVVVADGVLADRWEKA